MDELDYIKDIAKGMAAMAQKSGFSFLAYLIEMAADEAGDQYERERSSRERLSTNIK